jgi:SAM-dependent methyltransferase
MSQQQWNSRYSSEEYIYGTEPNAYLKAFLDNHEPGRILFPAEGEGRNAVYAATLGWQVDAFDQSEAAKQKAMKLADLKGVEINYYLSSLELWLPEDDSYDCIALIFVHLEPEMRKEVHKKVIKALKPGGCIVFEAFTKKQMPRTSGGPKNLDLLYDASEIQSDFSSLAIIELTENQVVLEEGTLHKGLADVVDFTAAKR